MIINPDSVPRHTGTNYPEKFQHWVKGRSKQKLGEAAGLSNFGVNLVTLQPGSYSSVRHWHLKQDEFIYIISGEITLISNQEEQILHSGDCAGFPAGEANGHHLHNKSQEIAQYLEIGDRTAEDVVSYPDVNLVATYEEQGWVFHSK